MKATSLRAVVICLCLAGIGILPYLIPITQVNMVIEIAFFSLYAMSFNMLFGYGGMLSFGHSAYFGLGAYTTALVFKYFTGVPLVAALLMGGMAGALGGLLAGFFCVRLKGAYFALLTMAFNQFFFAIALKWRSLTGGDDGLSIKRPDLYLPGLGGIPMNNAINIYYLVMVIVLLCILVQWYLTTTPFGNSALAIKENDERADFIGYDIFSIKLTLLHDLLILRWCRRQSLHPLPGDRIHEFHRHHNVDAGCVHDIHRRRRLFFRPNYRYRRVSLFYRLGEPCHRPVGVHSWRAFHPACYVFPNRSCRTYNE